MAKKVFLTRNGIFAERHAVPTEKRNFFKSDAQDINTMERDYLAKCSNWNYPCWCEEYHSRSNSNEIW